MTIPLMRTGTGEPVVLLHPFTLSQHIWAGVVERLAPQHDVLALTLAGHWGAPALGARTIESYADAVAAAMDEAGWASAHIVGNSLGGWVALELARRGRARSVVAIAPAGGWRHISTTSVAMGARFLAYFPLAVAGNLLGERVLRRRLIQRRLLRKLVHDVDAVAPDVALDVLRASTRCGAYLPTLWMALRHGGAARLDEIRVPILLALCAEDRFLPNARYAVFYQRNLPERTEHRMLPGVGHVPALENPRLVADTIAEFVARHRRGWSTTKPVPAQSGTGFISGTGVG
ncbi:alpha/beta fold hydrolase [Nocardia asteroides]|uniref:alpha/beta fold hydrolase n=1 Tax=Nocardia asteroides TaxID=1824 RepID=UPI00341899C9